MLFKKFYGPQNGLRIELLTFWKRDFVVPIVETNALFGLLNIMRELVENLPEIIRDVSRKLRKFSTCIPLIYNEHITVMP
jgi:hypothetical protein